MQIELNGENRKIDKRGCRHLGHLLAKIQEAFFSPGDILVRLEINGEERSGLIEEQESWQRIPSPEVRSIAMRTESAMELSLETLTDVRDQMPHVENALERMCAKICLRDERDDAIRIFLDFISLFDGWVLPAFERIGQLFRLDMLEFEAAGISALGHINGFIADVEVGVGQVEAGADEDFRSLVLEQMIPRVRAFGELADQIADHLRRHDPAGTTSAP